jgi:hypothetical protein
MIKQIFLLIIFLILILSKSGISQEAQDSPLVLITTMDKNEYLGKISFEDEDIVKIITQNLGEITLRKSDIKNRNVVLRDQIIKGEVWVDNPQATRYFWSPNGYGLKNGEGYYQNVWVLFNQFAFGISDNFSLGAGFVPLFLFGGTATPVWITPKISIPVKKDKFNIGAGALAGAVIGEEAEGGFGIVYGTTTFGSRNKNISVGLGYGYAGGDWADAPVINFSAMIRVGRRGYVLTENYFLSFGDDTGALLSLGGRSVLGKIGLDYGGFVPLFSGTDTFIAFPWLGLTVPIGK